MGAVKKLDIEGFCARTDSYFAGMGESCSLDVGTKWETLKYVDDAIMEADRALFETPLEEFHGHGYESLRPELEREEADMKVLAAYPNLLRSELYENVDHKFMIGIRNKALETLSRIKVDEITIENRFGVNSVLHLKEPGGGETAQSDLKERIGIKDFVGYHSEKIETTSFVVGFTDILYKPQLEDGQTLQDFLSQNSEEMHELIYSGEYENKKYQPVRQFVSEVLDAVSLGILPLIKAATGYDFITDEELTENERIMALAEGVISLVGLGAVAKAGGFTAKTIMKVMIVQGAQQTAASGMVMGADVLGLPKEAGMVLGIMAGMAAEYAGISLIKRYTAMKKSGMIVGIEGGPGIVDDVIEGSGAGVKGGSKAANWADLMSPEDAVKYNKWINLREAGLDQPKINDIILTNKGYRPDPATYLSKEYIDAHLDLFSNGVTKISVSTPTGQAGPPGGTFIMPKSIADEIIQEANGNVAKLEQLLSLEPGTLRNSPVRLDIPEPHNLRMPSGNELGANEQWIPGGSTGGGIPEATIDSPSPKEFISTPIFKEK